MFQEAAHAIGSQSYEGYLNCYKPANEFSSQNRSYQDEGQYSQSLYRTNSTSGSLHSMNGLDHSSFNSNPNTNGLVEACCNNPPAGAATSWGGNVDVSTDRVRVGHPRHDVYISSNEMQQAQAKMFKKKNGVKSFDLTGFSNKMLRLLYSPEYLSGSGIQLEGRHCLKEENKLLAVIDEVNAQNEVLIEPDNPRNEGWKLFRDSVNSLCRRCRFEVTQSKQK